MVVDGYQTPKVIIMRLSKNVHVDPGKRKKRLDIKDNSSGKANKIFIISFAGYKKEDRKLKSRPCSGVK